MQRGAVMRWTETRREAEKQMEGGGRGVGCEALIRGDSTMEGGGVRGVVWGAGRSVYCGAFWHGSDLRVLCNAGRRGVGRVWRSVKSVVCSV